MTILRICIIIALLFALVRLRLNLGLSLIITSLISGIIFRVQFLPLVKTIPLTLFQTTTIEFLFIIYMVLLLAIIMELSGNLQRIITTMEETIGDYRIGIALMPALIGLLPMPAGAMLSAPIVKQGGIKANLSPEKMTFINFWFRHLWEYWWPLYPSILISAGVFNLPVRQIIISQFPLSLFAILVGIIFILRLPGSENSVSRRKKIWPLIYNLWPIILIILLVMIGKFRMSWAIGISGISALISSGIQIREIPGILKKAFSLSTLGIIYSVFL
ncbi:MAG: DUF401 family protein, partial [candidate division WOR-3 bacterium]